MTAQRVHLRRGDRRHLKQTAYCGADATIELAVLKDQHVTCAPCLQACAREINAACDIAEAFLAQLS